MTEKKRNPLVEDVAKALGWTYEQAGNFMGHFVASDPDRLRLDLESACEWAQRIEQMWAIVDVLRTAPADLIEARWDREAGEPVMRLTPEGR
jgi:hypothetical protein